VESWLPDLSDFYDPFTPLALEDDRQSEEDYNSRNGKLGYDGNARLSQLRNQNFNNSMKISQYEDQLEILEAEAMLQYRESSERCARLSSKNRIDLLYEQMVKQYYKTRHLHHIYCDRDILAPLLRCNRDSGKRKYDLTILEHVSNNEPCSSTTDKRRCVYDTFEVSDITAASSSTAVTVPGISQSAVTDLAPDMPDVPPKAQKNKSSRPYAAVVFDTDYETLDFASQVPSRIDFLTNDISSWRSKDQDHNEREFQTACDCITHGQLILDGYKQLTHILACLSERLAISQSLAPNHTALDKSGSSTTGSPTRTNALSLESVSQLSESSRVCSVAEEMHPVGRSIHSGVAFSDQDVKGDPDKMEAFLPRVVDKQIETNLLFRIDAGWYETLNETTANEQRMVGLRARLRQLDLVQVLKNELDIKIDIQFGKVEYKLSKRKDEVNLILDCINCITRDLLED
jgi:hypothetical protein